MQFLTEIFQVFLREAPLQKGAGIDARCCMPLEVDNPEFAIQSKGPWGELSRIKVKEGETTLIECGPPFKAKAKVLRRERVVSVGYWIVGKAGADYTKAFSWPEVTVVDEKDYVLAMGRFGAG